MERTDYVAKARMLMKKTALVIVPLAMAASAASAATLPTDNASCLLLNPFSSCQMGAVPIPGSGVTGVEFFTPGSQLLVESGSGTTGSFNRFLTMETLIDPFNDVLPGSLPVSYDFSLWQDPSVTVGIWSLRMEFRGRYHGSILFAGSGVGDFSGQGIVNLVFDSGQSFQGLSAVLSVDGTRTSMANLFVAAPEGRGFDFGPSVAVPEPATMGIAGAGLAMAAWFGRRRKRSNSST